MESIYTGNIMDIEFAKTMHSSKSALNYIGMNAFKVGLQLKLTSCVHAHHHRT